MTSYPIISKKKFCDVVAWDSILLEELKSFVKILQDFFPSLIAVQLKPLKGQSHQDLVNVLVSI